MTSPMQDILPSASSVAAINIFDGYNNLVEHLENKGDSQSSVQLLNYLSTIYDGVFDKDVAINGLSMYEDYLADALANPGKHPYLDLLLSLSVDQNAKYRIEVISV
ncbi:hypothetical protein CJP74_00630 [Psittacicella melopsittaci]|uniref:Uncharacterized protein n=1 Tax=Psittacicella melopsittaci TaxID=2028576 RepID=A0A3A1Y6T8_9GAMM|nr:DUF2322 family protein [Psittacicella melopsittaci]RIY33962.1 hypothetical protein CJP74_00630 [Psittacicella melopsittaci]